MKHCAQQIGTTLIELVVSIVIIGISMTGIMMVIAETTRHSADPTIRIQAGAIAQAYMEEILAQALDDPDGAETGSFETGESRSTFDDVSDYHGLADSDGAVDQAGNPVAGLEAYNIAVVVNAVTLGGAPAKRVTVTVTFDGAPDFGLPISSHRLN